MLWSDVVPLRAILFQSLFILVAIATESPFLRYFFQYSWQKSVEVSSALNLFAFIFGWLIIYNAIDGLSLTLKQDLIKGIFFNQITLSLRSWLVFGCTILFFALWIAKMGALICLDMIREFSMEAPTKHLEKMESATNSGKLLWLLGAHAVSYSLIMLMISIGALIV